MARNKLESNVFKAIQYELLAKYYKYINADLHQKFYQKHLHYLNKVISLKQRDWQIRAMKPGFFRILHAAPETDHVDIFLNGNKIYKDIDFSRLTNYLSLPVGQYYLDIYPTNKHIHTIQSRKITIEPDKKTTYALTGFKHKEKLIPYSDHRLVNNNETKVRFIHLSPDTTPVDIRIAGHDPIFQQLPYPKATEYLNTAPANIPFEIMDHANQQLLIQFPVKLMPGKNHQLYLIGSANKEPELKVIIDS